jgi:hypothetical protein
MKEDMNLLPHGKIYCHDCFKGSRSQIKPHPKWLLRNDPGAWGSQQPAILILGFSKGATQTDIYQHGSFDDIAFGGVQTRCNLTNILHSVNLLSRQGIKNQGLVLTAEK